MKLLCKIGIVAIIFLIGSCKKDSTDPGNGTQNPPNGTQKKVYANAGSDQVITIPIKTVVLNGTTSYDVTGAPLNYSWKVHLSPSASITNGTTSIASALLTIPAKYIFILDVWNNNGAATDTVEVILNDLCAVAGTVIPQLIQFSHVPEDFDWETPKIFAAGKKLIIPKDWEYNNVLGSNPISIYDVDAHSYIKRYLPTSRSDAAIIVAGNKVFFAGGETNYGNFPNSLTDKVEIYDIITDSWTSTQLSESRKSIKAAVAGNKVVFAGGWKNGDVPSKTVDIYDLQTGQWSASVLTGPAREVGAAVAIQDKVYFCGGVAGGQIGATKIIDIYNTITGTWSIDSMAFPRIMFTAIAANGKIYFAGGLDMTWGPLNTSNPNNYLANVEVKNVNLSTSQNYCLSRKLAGATSVMQGEKVIFFSGLGDISGKIDIYNTTNDSWSVASVSNVSLAQSSIVALNNELYVIAINGPTKLYKLIL